MERKRADVIADALEGLIFDGSFENGERLDEVQLAARFSVSRTPIREAFQRLAQSGLVEQIPRRGVFVRQPGPLELIEVQSGSYLGEDDIERLEDTFGRA